MFSWLDISGSIFGFLATYCYIRVNIWGWPLSLVAIVIDIILNWQKGIYGNMGLQFMYFGLSLYGWYQWKYSNHKQGLSIRNLTPKEIILFIPVAILGFIAIFTLLKSRDSQITYFDTSVVVLSLLAQWMSCKKIIENWWLWLVVDIILIGLYAYEKLPVHAGLFLIYTGMAVAGYINWKKLKV